MACSYPIKGYRKKHPEPSGKYKMTINPAEGNTAHPMQVPCGKCTRCRLERARYWAIRCTHEAMMNENNCFVTLTYNDRNIPPNRSLRKRDFQNFMKRVRKKYGAGIRYYHCGEYGERTGRPHYHAILFGHTFPDQKVWKNNLHTSKQLERLWPYGFSCIGQVTFESAGYVARYVLKKQYGKTALFHYNTIDLATGEITAEREPEYTTMSRRPGIGATFFERHGGQIARRGEITMRGKQLKAPRFYDERIKAAYPLEYQRIKSQRTRQALKNLTDNTDQRLNTKEQVAKLNQRARRTAI